MKKLNLKFFGLRAKMVLPLFLLLGLFLFGANSATAQNYKSLEEAANIVKTELTEVQELGGHAYDVAATNGENVHLVARYEYFMYMLKSGFALQDVGEALDVTFQKMKSVYTEYPMQSAIVDAHNRAVDLLTND